MSKKPNSIFIWTVLRKFWVISTGANNSTWYLIFS